MTSAPGNTPNSRTQQASVLSVVLMLVVALIIWWLNRDTTNTTAPEIDTADNKAPAEPVGKPTPTTDNTPAKQPAEASPAPTTAATSGKMRTSVGNVSVRDLNGKTAFLGTVELGPTLARIKAGKSVSHRNDGSTFENREGKLPRKPSGYYKEYVHPTPGIGGPGPQRIVIGSQGETYYTHDHYKTFQRLDSP